MIHFPRFQPPPQPHRQEPPPVQPPPAPPKPVEAAPRGQSTFEAAPGRGPGVASAPQPPALAVASNLHTEQLGDGRANCLEKAVSLARPGDSIILMRDASDGVGHALVRRPDGSVVDPNHPEVRYETLGQWQALHPRYSQPVTVPAAQVKQVLSTPPGEKREALIAKLGLSGVADRQVADEEPRWVAAKNGLNVRSGPSAQTELAAELKAGDKMQVVGQVAGQDGYTWFEVRLPDGSPGWVRSDLVSGSEAPPPPPPPPPPPRFPDWVAQGTQPPFMDPAEWEAMGQAGQARFIQDSREHVVAKTWPQPEFDVNGPPPPSIDMLAWSHLPDDAKQVIFAQQWQAAVREQTDLLFNGVPEGGAIVEHSFLGVDSELGRGKVGQWLKYTANPAAESAAQYLNLRTLFGGDWPKVHNNLCGPLAVGASLGKTIQQALTLFKESVSADVLKGGGVTSGAQLMAMYTAAGWTSEYRGSQMTKPEDMSRLLAEGKQLTALVNIHTTASENGMLNPLDMGSRQTRVAHWVDVLSVEETPNGDWMVRVYNPFENREEVYSWNDFQAAWADTYGGKNEKGEDTFNQDYGMIIATPPAE